jgi:hypothetical protein
MPRAKRQVHQRKSTLIVVEGDTEFAFCRYLKSVLCHRQNVQIIIKNSHGGSPDKIVDYAYQLTRHASFDQVAILVDSDKPLGAKGLRLATRMKAQLFPFTPCIEGFFLELLGLPVPSDSEACKRKFHQEGLEAEAKLRFEAYEKLFPGERMNRMITNQKFRELKGLFLNEGVK